MPAPERPRLSHAITINLTDRLRSDLQELADRKLAPVSQVIREACMDVVERARTQPTGHGRGEK